MERGIPHYAQWFPGKENSVTDALSLDFHLTDTHCIDIDVARVFLTTTPSVLPDHPFARNDHYLRWKSAAIASQDAAVNDGTRSQRSRSWDRYLLVFLNAIGHHHDPYLYGLDRWERLELLSCFVAAVKEGLSRADDAGRALGSRRRRQTSTVRATVDSVAQTFRANKLGSPMHDSRGRLEPILAAQLKGYINEDPGTAQQQAVPAAVVSIASQMRGTNLGEAAGQLIVTAFFFAMRSCEYLAVQGSRRTVPIRLGDVEFRMNGRMLRSKNALVLSGADAVSITFKTQKNGDKGTVVTQHRTGTDTTTEALCPVIALAHLVARIADYYEQLVVDGTNCWERIADRPINLVRGEQTAVLLEVTSTQVLHHLRAAAVQQYGEDRLGFPLKKLGTHSLRSGAATAMFIAGVPVETIKLIG